MFIGSFSINLAKTVIIPFHLPIEKNYSLFYLYRLSRHKTSVFLPSLGSLLQTEEWALV